METAETAPFLLWSAAGSPSAKWPTEATSGCCATCGIALTQGVSTETIVSVTFSAHADFLRFGSHVCPACAWFYSYPKENHRNIIAAGSSLWWPMISWETATAERPSWYTVLTEIAALPHAVPCAGVLTTDHYPRLWPRTRPATVGAFGLYVHCPDYDVSGFVRFALQDALTTSLLVQQALTLGFTKASVYYGLWRDYLHLKKHPVEAAALERQLTPLRSQPYFLPALLISSTQKEHKGDSDGPAPQHARPSRAQSRGPAQEQPRLL